MLELVPFGLTEVVTVVLRIDTPDRPDRIALVSATLFHHRQLCRRDLHLPLSPSTSRSLVSICSTAETPCQELYCK
jgi:hypothetical protein